MALINITSLPTDVAGPLVELEAALANRRDLERRSSEAAAAEPPAEGALDAARVALDDAEMEFALATDEDEKALRQTRDRKRREFAEAEEFLGRIRQLRRGTTKRAERADAMILAAKAAIEPACKVFCDDMLARLRNLCHGSVFGSESGNAYADVLKLGYALLDVLPFTGSLRSTLEKVDLPDIGPAPGRSVPRFIQGSRSWPNDDDLAGASLRDWQDNPEIVALHGLLKPLGTAHAAATVQARRIDAERQRAEVATPPAPMVAPPEPPKVSSEEFLASQPTLEEHRAIMRGYAAESTKGITPPVRHTYSEPYSKPERFDSVTLA